MHSPPSIVLAAAWAAIAPAQQPGPSTPPPNIVFIMADDLGYGELGCYGQQHIRTPHLDRLAGEGMKFTRAYAGAPVCAPSRCVLMTGQQLGQATVRDNFEFKPEGQHPILAAEVTIAEVLRGAGYVNGCFGKWGLGFPGSEGDPLSQGFDRFYGYNCQRHAHNFYPRYLWSDRQRVELEGNDRGLTGEQYSHDLIEAETLAFLEAHRDRPFFCYVPFTLPHLALQVPDTTLELYQGAFEETPYEGRSYLPHPTPKAAYAAMITHLDASVGRIVAAIDRMGLGENTLIVFTSDNGPTHLKRQADVDFFGSAGGLRGLKGSVFEGGLRVPTIARWTGVIEPGSTTDHVCSFQDYLPTFAELAGQPVPNGVDGVSMAATLRGDGAQATHDHLYWDFPGYGGQWAVLMGRYKAVRRGLRKNPDAPWQLFDLEADPVEADDIAAANPELIARAEAIVCETRTEPVYETFAFGDYVR